MDTFGTVICEDCKVEFDVYAIYLGRGEDGDEFGIEGAYEYADQSHITEQHDVSWQGELV